MTNATAPGHIDPALYRRIPGPKRRYIHIPTGQEVSRRQAMIGSSGYSPEEAVAARRGITVQEYQKTAYQRAKARAQAEGYANPYQKAKATPTNLEYWKERARQEVAGAEFKFGKPRLTMRTRRELMKRMGKYGYQSWVHGQYRRGRR